MSRETGELQAALNLYASAIKDKNLEQQRQQVVTIGKLLSFDHLNLHYFLSLYRAFVQQGESNSLKLVIKDESSPKQDGVEVVPTAICSKSELAALPITQYQDLKVKADTTGSIDVVLWVKKMQAGTGSSMVRDRYVASRTKTSVEQVKIGAKGTDLDIEHSDGGWPTLAEVQILQGIADHRSSAVGEVVLHDIVSSETASAVKSIWQQEATLAQSSESYDHLFSQTDGLNRFEQTMQQQLPTIDGVGQISFDRVAPGGHALFGLDAVMAAYKSEMRPTIKEGQVLISSIGNGEDLGSSPDGLIASWMAREKIAVVMVTTTKSEIDLKGGQLAVVNGDTPYIAMLEKAQAESSGQIALFEQLGLREGDSEAFFNTNMVLINYNIFTPLVEKLLAEVGEEELLSIATPDLILNVKKQLDSQGAEQSFTQLEGAMGSLFLNLDRFWRERYGQPLVHFLNVGKQDRTQFFSPVKTAFDYFVQTRSDRFSLCEKSFRLINHNPDYLPQVALGDSYYKSVTNVLAAFEDCNILELNSLHIKGKVDCSGTTLKGMVSLVNNSDEMVVLKNYLGQAGLTVEEQEIVFD
jgi:hypothetical protein